MQRVRGRMVALAGLALAGGAAAQVGPNGGAAITSSSVALFGVVDAAVAWGKGDIADRLRLVSGAHTGSRLGFRASEDLGGGLGAGIWLEAGVNADDGSGIVSNANNQPGDSSPGGLMFGRRATVSIVGDWGELRLGRDNTATYRNREQTDPFATNGVGGTQVNAGTIAGVTSTRASNMIGYFLPVARLGGFFGEAQYFMGENPDNAANSNDGDGYQLRLGYATKTWGLAAAWGVTRYATTAPLGDIEVWNVGGHYDFGLARVSAGYFQDKVEQVVPLTGTGYTVGAVFPVGVHAVRLAYSTYGTDAAGDPTTRKLALGYVHNLSRRTLAYVTYAHLDNRGPAAVGLNGSQNGPGDGSDGFDLGLKHSF